MATTTTIQHNHPISLVVDDDDDENIALSNYLTKSFQPQQKQELWLQSKQQQQTYVNYKQQRRPRTLQMQKSNSTPIPSNRSTISQQPQRRPSMASSIESDASTTSKVSLSKRLRKVFSMSNIRSSKDLSTLKEINGSIVSIPSSLSSTDSRPSLRRRSIASLSSLFQKHSIQEEQETVENKNKPGLRVDVKQRKKGINNDNHNTVTPDSPNSAISSRSFTRLPPPVITNQRFIEALPSPTPSSSSSSSHELKKPHAVGLHYGIGLHASPKLRPAASSSSSSLVINEKRKIQFCTTIQVHETFSALDYDRRCNTNATCQKLTPVIAMKVKQELNEYKLSEMEVHVESRQYTHFFL